MTIGARLDHLGLTIPPASIPVANYAPTCQSGSLLYVSGHVSSMASPPVIGKVGRDLTTEQAKSGARAVCLLLLGTAQGAVGDLDRVVQVVKLTGLVNATDDFTEHSRVIDGASDLLVEVFGERGRHARAAFGASGLPAGAAVEIEMVLEVR